MPRTTKLRRNRDVRQRVPQKLSKLVPFPLQTQLEGTTTPAEDVELKNDIERNGLREPIHVLPKNAAGLPENTILDGHRRWMALLALQRTVELVEVRHDLADAPRDRIEEEFFRFNLQRRQLSPLAKARMAKGWIESQRAQTSSESGELRERIGKLIGYCGRHLDRFLSVLQTPMEVQAAFERKALSLIEAEKVSRLTEDEQSQIAQRIQGGEPPRKVVAEYGPPGRTGQVKRNDAFVAFMKMLRRGIDDLADRVNRVSPRLVADCQDDLRRARKLFGALLDRRPPSPEDERYW